MRVSRAKATVAFPSKVLLVAAMNPCPCGEGGPPGACPCSEAMRHRYIRRVSGPLVDRFDLRVPVMRPSVDELMGPPVGESTATVAARVAAARDLAAARGVERQRRHRRGAARRGRAARSRGGGPPSARARGRQALGARTPPSPSCRPHPVRSARRRRGHLRRAHARSRSSSALSRSRTTAHSECERHRVRHRPRRPADDGPRSPARAAHALVAHRGLASRGE